MKPYLLAFITLLFACPTHATSLTRGTVLEVHVSTYSYETGAAIPTPRKCPVDFIPGDETGRWIVIGRYKDLRTAARVAGSPKAMDAYQCIEE